MPRFLSLLLTLAALVLTTSHAPGAAGRAWHGVAAAHGAPGAATPAPPGAGSRVGARAPTRASEAVIQPSPPSVVSIVRRGNPAPGVRTARHVAPTAVRIWAAPAPAAACRAGSARTARLATEFALAARGAHAPVFSTAPPLRG